MPIGCFVTDVALSTPVVLIIFNRPEKTERVFAEIEKVRPTKLLVVGDGARVDRASEIEKVAATRRIIERVNWPCEVLTNYSELNLGCKLRVSSGLNWVFEQVEQAIILEDDCVPHTTFFKFCEELLERYRNNQSVGMIAGCNLQLRRSDYEYSYHFSNTTPIWGWSTWRDRWQSDYDLSVSKWPEIRDSGKLSEWFEIKEEHDSYKLIFERVFQGLIDTWDYQWQFACRLNGRVAIVPNVNLISNIGFGLGATHTKEESYLANMVVEEMKFPLNHPRKVIEDNFMDKKINTLSKSRILKNRLINFVKKLI
jgi:hypothetical protein